MDLKELRTRIEDIDSRILQCLAERRDVALAVAQSKANQASRIRDTERETSLLLQLMEQGAELGLDPSYLTRLYHIIIEDSVLMQQAWVQQGKGTGTLQIAHLGTAGSYSHLAAQGYAGRRQCQLQGLSCETFRDVLTAVEDGRTPLGILPIENSTSGSINEVYDLLRHTHLHIVAETYLSVEHQILVREGEEETPITTLYGHPQAIAQCSRYLSHLDGVNVVACPSSAHAMEKVANSQESGIAALGSQSGGALFRLVAVANNLADQPENQTRFILVQRQPVQVPSQLPARTSVIMATHNHPGALADALIILRQHELNLIKLESRPMPGNPWEELFYMDIAIHEQSPQWQGALKELKSMTRFMKVLGCYADERVKATHVMHPERSQHK
ncbi:prephenate dehydratase [Aliidiomarina halalkaliphila]|uniref:Bifunctional chorismate mutase/prephenate dehydratase n=1 Tax=Aliidiomarina halalkaliphila TaxID=2593535 RepID=A0A552X096_9GAMM|nr:prephenate dehydratase [Aliidiomarina halalkaliphila]TRW48477.1 prephenate dehydratase [Aliidiomarina halalkaliphila]